MEDNKTTQKSIWEAAGVVIPEKIGRPYFKPTGRPQTVKIIEITAGYTKACGRQTVEPYDLAVLAVVTVETERGLESWEISSKRLLVDLANLVKDLPVWVKVTGKGSGNGRVYIVELVDTPKAKVVE